MAGGAVVLLLIIAAISYFVCCQPEVEVEVQDVPEEETVGEAVRAELDFEPNENKFETEVYDDAPHDSEIRCTATAPGSVI